MQQQKTISNKRWILDSEGLKLSFTFFDVWSIILFHIQEDQKLNLGRKRQYYSAKFLVALTLLRNLLA